MDTLRKEAIDAIEKLPDTADIEDIMYRLYVIDKIKKGEEALQRGEQISIDDLKKEIALKENRPKQHNRFQQLRGIATVQMTTDEIMALTREDS